MSLKKYQSMELPQNGLLDKHSVNGTAVTLLLIPVVSWQTCKWSTQVAISSSETGIQHLTCLL